MSNSLLYVLCIVYNIFFSPPTHYKSTWGLLDIENNVGCSIYTSYIQHKYIKTRLKVFSHEKLKDLLKGNAGSCAVFENIISFVNSTTIFLPPIFSI